MSTRILPRRLNQSVLTVLRPRSTYWIATPSRSFSDSSRLRKEDFEKDVTKAQNRNTKEDSFDANSVPDRDPNDSLSNPLLERYLSTLKPYAESTQPETQTGTLSETSIFKPEYEIPGWRDDLTPLQQDVLKERETQRKKKMVEAREMELHAPMLDPVPRARRRLERKLVIKSLEKRGRLSKSEKLMRTERENLYRSQFLPTSVKKLTKLMNQIQGKTVEEALVQLRFSKKLVARDVLKGLQIARDEAIAARGMGLGSANAAGAEGLYLADGTMRNSKAGEGVAIELKNGKKKVVHDPTEMYVDQAWVGRGPYTRSLEFRARGRTNVLRHRSTSFSVLLKEEKTRMRLSDEIQKKRANRKLWLPLPDRPVTSQRQYCLW